MVTLLGEVPAKPNLRKYSIIRKKQLVQYFLLTVSLMKEH